jgi:hypothetical protein
METISSEALAAQPSLSMPVCVLVPAASAEPLGDTARWLGADALMAEQLTRSIHRRPLAHVQGQQISVVAFATMEPSQPMQVHLHAGERGLLVLCPDQVADVVRQAVASVDGQPVVALVTVLLALARLSEEAVASLSELALALNEKATRLTSGVERRNISRARARLFTLQQLWTGHGQLLQSDGALAEAVPEIAQG